MSISKWRLVTASAVATTTVLFGLGFCFFQGTAAETQAASGPAATMPTTAAVEKDPFASIRPYLEEMKQFDLLKSDKWVNDSDSRQRLRVLLVHIDPILEYYVNGFAEGKFKTVSKLNDTELPSLNGRFTAIGSSLSQIQKQKFLYHKAGGQNVDCIDDHLGRIAMCMLPLLDKAMMALHTTSLSGIDATGDLVKDVSENTKYSKADLKKLLAGMIKFEPIDDCFKDAFEHEVALLNMRLQDERFQNALDESWKAMLKAKLIEEKDVVDTKTAVKQYEEYVSNAKEWIGLGFLKAHSVAMPEAKKNPLIFRLQDGLGVWKMYRQFMENYYLAEYLLAAKLFYMEEGKLPESLAELDKKYFGGKGKPDMFSEKPLNFAKGENSIKIWSVGPDMKDDGGKEMAQDRTGDLVVEFKPQ